MAKIKTFKAAAATAILFFASQAAAFTSAQVPADGIYRFSFGVSETSDDSIPVPANAVCDVKGSYTDTFSYGFLGTTDTSYLDDVPSNLPSIPHAIDGFKVVKGQKIVLHDGTDANGKPVVYGPAASEYLPEGASSHEGRYPIRFSMRAEERGYYAVTCTVANASSTANADVTLFSERCHTHVQHLALAPGETKTFAWSVELAPNYFKTPAKYYYDNAINVVVVGENAALASLTVVKQPTTTENATIRGEAQTSINVGKTMWLCDDSTGTDQRCDTPYFNLQNYAGTGSGLSRWAPADLSIRNQGEGGLSTSAGTHRNSCLLKPGDYLYVQYGHNESNTTSFTNNLEQYLTDANAAGANLIIVSPVERHNVWDSTTETYARGLQGYAEAGEAWVEEKIEAGARNVAFVDLNKAFNDWQNEEIVRIHKINSAVSKKAAIEFYYQSSKGGKVDVSHPNNAGADWGAYSFWQNALARVAAGEAEGATDSEKIQAAVLKGITEGTQMKVGVGGTADNIPWSVSDEIINAGTAPNSFWDQAVRAGYDYANDAAVAAVDATCADGVVTLNGVTMRVLNQCNYTKAVVDVVDSSFTTNRWYSFYNYDASGNTSGDLVVPEVAGFIDSDLGKDDSAEGHFSSSLTIPAGSKAYIHFAEASGNTWQVGDNAPCSAIYPLEAWTSVLLDDDCSSISTWSSLFGGIHTFEVPDGGNYISFSMTGWDDSGNNKKNGGFAHQFADSATVSSGRIRISFKALYTQGELRFALSDKANTSTSPMDGGDIIAKLNGTALVADAAVNATLTADETPLPQSTINSGEWMDVDLILNLDNCKVLASIAGSDYATYTISSLTHTPYSWFGVTLASEKAHAGAIDDVKIVTLAPSPRYLVEVAVNNAAYGHVEINGSEATSLNAVEGADVALSAVSADPTLYKFVEWQDSEGETVSVKETLVIESIAAAASYTAVFRAYGHDENRVTTWDFSEYAGDFAVAPSAAMTIEKDGMTFVLQSGDAITGDGLKWANSALDGEKTKTLSETGSHYITYTPSVSGTLTLKFSVDNYNSSRKPRVLIKEASSASDCQGESGDKKTTVEAAGTEYTLTAELTAEKTYYIWSYSYNWSGGNYYHNYTIPSITYAYAPTWVTASAAVADGSAGRGTAAVSEAEVVSGKSVTFTATPVSAAYRFVNWTDGEDGEVSTEAAYTAAITANTTLYANFEAIEAGTTYNASVDFAHAFGGSAAVSATANTSVTRGDFTYFLQSGDSLTDEGLYWDGTSLKTWDGTVGTTGRHIEWKAPADGTVEIVFRTSKGYESDSIGPYLCVATNEQAMTYKSTAWAYKAVGKEATTDTVLTFEATAGTLYKIYSYYQNRDMSVTISSITYTDVVSLVALTLATTEGGAVAINGVAGAGSYTVQAGEYVCLTATPNANYGLSNWTDGENNVLSTEEEFWCHVDAAKTVTANFASESLIDITRTADFSVFTGDDAIMGEEAWSQLVGRMEVHGAAGDTLTDAGIYWAGPGTTTSDTKKNTSGRYIKFECKSAGTLSLTFNGTGSADNKNYPRMYVTDGTTEGIACMYKDRNDHIAGYDNKKGAFVSDTFSCTVASGKTYYIWPYYYNKPANKFYVTAISYAAVKSDYSAVTVEGADGSSVTNLYYGSSIALDAPATSGTKIFEGWVSGEETLGTSTHLFYTATNEVTLTASYREADAHNFVWKPTKTSGAWNDAKNWLYEGLVNAATYPSDPSQDVATIGTEATISLASAAATSNAVFNAATTLTGGTLTAVQVDGSGVVTLSTAGFATPLNVVMTIDANIAMTAGTTNYFNTVANAQWGTEITINGNISGSGCYQLNLAKYQGCGIKLNGNNNDFYGDAYTSGGASNRSRIWWGENSAGTNTYWHIEHSYRNDDNGRDDACMGGSVKLGGWDGPWQDRYDDKTIMVGYLNRDSTININNSQWTTLNRANNVVKVGSANLTLGTTIIKNLTINEGSVTMPVGIAPQTLTVAEGAKIYVPAGEWTAENTYDLFSYTTLAGVDEAALEKCVKVVNLAPGLAAKIKVSENVVSASIDRMKGLVVFVQ